MLSCAQKELLAQLATEHAAATRHSLRLATATFGVNHTDVRRLRLQVERAEGTLYALEDIDDKRADLQPA